MHERSAPDVRLRPGKPGDAPALSALALRSKGYWGYDQDFLEACRSELAITPSEVVALRVTVATDATDRPLGFSTLEGEPPDGEVGKLFVEPDRIGSGLGRLLWSDVASRAAALGFRSLRIEADPGAAPFYEAMGAVVVGSCPSGSIPGRRLPLLTYQVPPSSSG